MRHWEIPLSAAPARRRFFFRCSATSRRPPSCATFPTTICNGSPMRSRKPGPRALRRDPGCSGGIPADDVRSGIHRGGRAGCCNPPAGQGLRRERRQEHGAAIDASGRARLARGRLVEEGRPAATGQIPGWRTSPDQGTGAWQSRRQAGVGVADEHGAGRARRLREAPCQPRASILRRWPRRFPRC